MLNIGSQSDPPALLTPKEAMAIFGYRDRSAFLRMVRASGLPRVRVNRRVIRFEPRAIQAFLRRRAVGALV